MNITRTNIVIKEVNFTVTLINYYYFEYLHGTL